MFITLIQAQTPIKLDQSFATYTNVREPSALSFSVDKKTLFTVSDNNGSIYELNLQGKILREIKTGLSDLEGIITHPDLGGFCLVEERIRTASCLDNTGKELKRKTIPFQGESNSGFEGISYNPLKKQFFIVNEKKPKSIITLDTDFNIVNTVNFDKALDLSDIFYDDLTDQFWLLSHESKEIYLTDSNFEIEKVFSIPSIVQAEGIVVDSKNKKIYIISDKDSSFTIFNY